MKKRLILISLIAMAIIFAPIIFSSCGDSSDEPNDDWWATHVQDGNGQTFVEGGKIVPARLSFTEEELKKAVSGYEWVRSYAFYYDNNKIGMRTDISAFGFKIFQNYYSDVSGQSADIAMEYPYAGVNGKIWNISIYGKKLITNMNNEASSRTYPTYTYTVVALDFVDGKGRMIMDYDMEGAAKVDGFNSESLAIRLIWYTK